MKLALLAMVCGASACRFEPGRLSGDSNVVEDAAADQDGPVDTTDDPDTFVVTADGQECWGVPGVGVNVCLDDPLTGMADLGVDTVVNTGNVGTGAFECKALRAGSSDVCAIVAQTISIPTSRTLAATGPKPLVLLASTVTIDGTLDVASHLRGRTGPAIGLGGCNNGTGPSGAGGGQGGSFGGMGGNGGNQHGQTNRGTAGNVQASVTTLRGGCFGGHGGGTSFSHGEGGGAVLVIADMLVVTGRINASGGGGEAGFAGTEGGGGGGSGGMIVLAATTITLDAGGMIYANGGHGGGGSDDSTNAMDGSDPTGPTSGGTGGNASGNGGDGAPGYPSASRNGSAGTGGGDGGGGGGGGAGIVRVYSTTTIAGANVSPPPS